MSTPSSDSQLEKNDHLTTGFIMDMYVEMDFFSAQMKKLVRLTPPPLPKQTYLRIYIILSTFFTPSPLKESWIYIVNILFLLTCATKAPLGPVGFSTLWQLKACYVSEPDTFLNSHFKFSEKIICENFKLIAVHNVVLSDVWRVNSQ